MGREGLAPVNLEVRRVPCCTVSAVTSLLDFVRNDIAKLLKFAAVSAFTVPLGLTLTWIFLEVLEMEPVVANLTAVVLATIPNYILNRYWVWNKRGSNSVTREIAPFWIMALLGAVLSSILVWIAKSFTDSSIVFLAMQFIAFGFVWIIKFFVLEKYLFGPDAQAEVPVVESLT